MPLPGEQNRRYYPGMVPAEESIWRAWLREHELDLDYVEYDVAVGAGVVAPIPPDTKDVKIAERVQERFRQLTQKRIDVLARRGQEWLVIEVEERASFTALGQATGYVTLLAVSRPEIVNATAVVIARYVSADDLTVYQNANVLLFQVTLPGDQAPTV